VSFCKSDHGACDTWANEWNTACRMHEVLDLPCIFGCDDCEYDLDHFVVHCGLLCSHVLLGKASSYRLVLLRNLALVTQATCLELHQAV